MSISDTWFAELESTIFTTVQYELKIKDGAPFPKLKCTTVSQSDKPSEFPTLYLHELPEAELGQDLENRTVNAVRCTIETQVFSNKSETEVRKILSAVILVMKGLRFNVTMFPDPDTRNGIAVGIARFSRVIGSGDGIVTGK